MTLRARSGSIKKALDHDVLSHDKVLKSPVLVSFERQTFSNNAFDRLAFTRDFGMPGTGQAIDFDKTDWWLDFNADFGSGEVTAFASGFSRAFAINSRYLNNANAMSQAFNSSFTRASSNQFRTSFSTAFSQAFQVEA